MNLLAALKEAAPKMRKIVIVSDVQSGRSIDNMAATEYVVRPPDLNQLLKLIRARVLNVPTVYEEKVFSEFAESEMMDSESRRDL
jgi:hypothetical protein